MIELAQVFLHAVAAQLVTEKLLQINNTSLTPRPVYLVA